MDKISAIRLFVRLVECGSFSAVGRIEGIGQPAVSKQIASLERHLGAQLVMRTSRQIVITEAGQMFYESARKLVDDYDALESSVGTRQRSPQGLIRVSTAPAHGRICITPLLGEFFRMYPAIMIEMLVSERHSDLLGDSVDVAIRHGRLADSSLSARKLCETNFVLVASPNYLALRGEPREVSDLELHACIVFTEGRDPYPWRFKAGVESISYVPRGQLLTGDAEHIRVAVLGGLGIAQAPFWLVADEIRTGQLQVLLPLSQPAPVPIHLVYRAARHVPRKLRFFMDYLVSAFALPDTFHVIDPVGTGFARTIFSSRN